MERRKTRPLYSVLACKINAYANCKEKWTGDKDSTYEWMEKHEDMIEHLCQEHLPHGLGFDNESIIVMDKCKNGNELCIRSSFHVMNENGMYDGWVDFTMTVKPCLLFSFYLTIKGKFGKKHQHLKDYIQEIFEEALDKQITV